jgi:hypothetical protein
VGGGTLIVSGSLFGTSSVSVTANATLNVSGAVNSAAAIDVSGKLSGGGSVGAVTVESGATIAPGDGLSTAGTALTIGGNVTLQNGSQFTVNLDDTNAKVDLLTISGGLTLNGNDTLTITELNGAPQSGNTYTIATFTPGDLTGTFATVNDLPVGAQIVYDNTDGAIELQLASVPEPATWASLIGGAGMLVLMRARRQRRHS